jgi:hypothetical protein
VEQVRADEQRRRGGDEARTLAVTLGHLTTRLEEFRTARRDELTLPVEVEEVAALLEKLKHGWSAVRLGPYARRRKTLLVTDERCRKHSVRPTDCEKPRRSVIPHGPDLT